MGLILHCKNVRKKLCTLKSSLSISNTYVGMWSIITCRRPYLCTLRIHEGSFPSEKMSNKLSYVRPCSLVRLYWLNNTLLESQTSIWYVTSWINDMYIYYVYIACIDLPFQHLQFSTKYGVMLNKVSMHFNNPKNNLHYINLLNNIQRMLTSSNCSYF